MHTKASCACVCVQHYYRTTSAFLLKSHVYVEKDWPVNGSKSGEPLCVMDQAVKTLYLCDIYVFAIPALQLSFLINSSADHVMDIG